MEYFLVHFMDQFLLDFHDFWFILKRFSRALKWTKNYKNAINIRAGLFDPITTDFLVNIYRILMIFAPIERKKSAEFDFDYEISYFWSIFDDFGALEGAKIIKNRSKMKSR